MMIFHVAPLENQNFLVEFPGQGFVFVRHHFHLGHVMQKKTEMILRKATDSCAHVEIGIHGLLPAL